MPPVPPGRPAGHLGSGATAPHHAADAADDRAVVDQAAAGDTTPVPPVPHPSDRRISAVCRQWRTAIGAPPAGPGGTGGIGVYLRRRQPDQHSRITGGTGGAGSSTLGGPAAVSGAAVDRAVPVSFSLPEI